MIADFERAAKVRVVLTPTEGVYDMARAGKVASAVFWVPAGRHNRTGMLPHG